LVFIDAGEDPIMVNDAIMSSNLLVTPIQGEKLKETLLNMNVSQWSCEEKRIRRVVRIQMVQSV
jgi:hypothetical protein